MVTQQRSDGEVSNDTGRCSGAVKLSSSLLECNTFQACHSKRLSPASLVVANQIILFRWRRRWKRQQWERWQQQPQLDENSNTTGTFGRRAWNEFATGATNATTFATVDELISERERVHVYERTRKKTKTEEKQRFEMNTINHALD